MVDIQKAIYFGLEFSFRLSKVVNYVLNSKYSICESSSKNDAVELLHATDFRCPRQESNLHQSLRTGLFYPLNYEGKLRTTLAYFISLVLYNETYAT